MRNMRLMLVVGAVFATTAFATACDEEATSCETDEDCDTEGGEVCDVAEGVCEIPCDTDADCDAEAAEVCCDSGDVKTCTDSCGGAGGDGGGGSGGGGGPCAAPPAEDCDAAGECRPECTGHGDCYSLTAYCAADGLCYGVAPGTEFNDCARASQAPAMGANGPVLFDAGQDAIGDGSNCTKDPANCTNNGNVCGFSFQYFDPEGDVPTGASALYSKLFWIDGSGDQQPTFGVPDVSGTTIGFTLCFDEALSTVGGAVQIQDNAGNNSQALCFEGSAP